MQRHPVKLLEDRFRSQIENLKLSLRPTDLPRRREQGFSANCLRLKNLPSDNG